MNSKWVSLVVCGLLSLLLVVPVQSGENLVNDGDFPNECALPTSGPPAQWTSTSGCAIVTSAVDESILTSIRSDLPVLTRNAAKAISVYQCVDTTAYTDAVLVGGLARFSDLEDGSIDVTLHASSDCADGSLIMGGGTITQTDGECQAWWCPLSGLYDLPSTGGAYVKVSLNYTGTKSISDVCFDDIYVEAAEGTRVTLAGMSAQTPWRPLVAAVLAILALAWGLRKR